MTTKRKPPPQKTVKTLFALSGGLCAFPGCRTRLVDQTSGAMLAEMCHIRALSSGGPRYDSTQGNSQRNKEDNLLLLCPTHHSLIDQASDKYTVDWLISIKQAHENWVKETLSILPKPINENQAADLSRQVAEESVDFAIVVALEKELAALLRYFPE